MNLPLNGRIAIIDDQINHAEPLMKILSKKQIPFRYFSGELPFLPDEGDISNDIRVLFLDINLIDNTERSNKELKAKLIPVLKKVISQKNYPYVIIYWSRHEHHKDLIENEIFEIELSDRKPIAYLSAMKSDFFNLDGTVANNFDTKINKLFSKVNSLIEQSPAYNYLLNWENKVHTSADKTLEEIFSSYSNFTNWHDNANYIINKLGVSFSGKAFEKQNPENKIKASYNALNIVYTDTLENTLNNCKITKAQILDVPKNATNLESINSINKKLLISAELDPIHYSGTIIEILDKKVDFEYEKMLDTILNKKGKKNDIILSWKKVWLSVTPLCDTVQGKIVFHRLVRGILVSKDFRSAFFSNEAIYVSPPFTYELNDYCLVVDFRQFFTLTTLNKSKYRNPLFRIRQQLLAEIQSKLARHINRQGILFLD
ncbi:hypothetical protein [Chryseobacterium sp. EO14]|uniref:hypothetical protein n=1 Tax=Chryseobacterium sp. EO14 TaxID=2950551 RepID=UPI00210EE989|nr:hypothetical protein [Chryseobacterium sp. EO14]MCQ4141513.1 hypothetical protein [Chryseobacterium sp. EO14]